MEAVRQSKGLRKETVLEVVAVRVAIMGMQPLVIHQNTGAAEVAVEPAMTTMLEA
tara:strand:- start:176 stop:340 length:165 start_codon:yes stop_codon:yes gene_type:complete